MHPPSVSWGVHPPKLAGMLLDFRHCLCRVWAGIVPAHPRPPRCGGGRGALATFAAAAALPSLPLHAALRAALLPGRALRRPPSLVACAPCRIPRPLHPRSCSRSSARTAPPAAFAPPGTPWRLVAFAPPRPRAKRQPASQRVAFAPPWLAGCSSVEQTPEHLRSSAIFEVAIFLRFLSAHSPLILRSARLSMHAVSWYLGRPSGKNLGSVLPF